MVPVNCLLLTSLYRQICKLFRYQPTPSSLLISRKLSYKLVFAGIVVDQNQALRFALDITRGMEFLHTMEPLVPDLYLTSKHVMVSRLEIKGLLFGSFH